MSAPVPGWCSKFLLGGLALILSGAIGLVVFGEWREIPRKYQGAVADLLPTAGTTEGWLVEKRPVADSAEAKRAVAELLNYNDAAYVIYTKERLRVSIYLAYWAPGRMSSRLVGGHTPDVCWVGMGWKQISGESRVQPLAAGIPVYPAEVRHMELNGLSEHLIFWHLLVGARQPAELSAATDRYESVAQLWRHGLDGRREQFFLRVSANAPLDQWWTLPFVQEVVSRVMAATRSV